MKAQTASQNTVSIATLVANEGLVVDLSKLADPGDPGRIVEVEPGSLHIDHSYQRQLNKPHATKIGQNFQFINMKIPSGFIDNSGKILITDGQHTCVAAFLAKIPTIKVYVMPMSTEIATDDAVAIQSKQFIAINSSSKPVSKYDMYRNLLIQKDADTLAMAAACYRAGVTPCDKTPASKRMPGAMSHISNLTNAWKQIGPKPTEEALDFLRKRFPNCPIDARLFYGLARFIQKFAHPKARNLPGSNYSLDILFDALTLNGSLDTMSAVSEHVDDESHHTNRNTKTTLDVWVAKTIRWIYNDHVGKDSPDFLKAFI
jgi:hypothetical protein